MTMCVCDSQQTASLVDESSGADRGRLVLSISSLTGVSAVARRATHAARRLELAHVSIAQVSDELERLRVASSGMRCISLLLGYLMDV